MLTCTTRTKLSGYLVNTAEKASTGSRSTVESRAARADTVRWGCWWPWRGMGQETGGIKMRALLAAPRAHPSTHALRDHWQRQRGLSGDRSPHRQLSANQPH